jgi:hypothetical protein
MSRSRRRTLISRLEFEDESEAVIDIIPMRKSFTVI